jgi:hypothetical protein
VSYYFIDNELPSRTPEELKGFCGYGIRRRSTGRWYKGAGQFSDYPDSRHKGGYLSDESLWLSLKAARRTLSYSLRPTEISLLEAVPLYLRPPEDFQEWVETLSWRGRYAAGTPISL